MRVRILGYCIYLLYVASVFVAADVHVLNRSVGLVALIPIAIVLIIEGSISQIVKAIEEKKSD